MAWTDLKKVQEPLNQESIVVHKAFDGTGTEDAVVEETERE